jgi:AcrR family transcriptional regulator
MGTGITSTSRRTRADSIRNRERLVEAATHVFSTGGRQATLEAVAREAGVGIGTLYRHFPTREALVEAVYAAELDDVTDSAPALLDALAPEEALRAWMDRYAAFVATKRGMADVLRASVASGRIATPATRQRITAAIGTILDAGAQAGTLRADAAPEDVTLLLLGTFLSTADQRDPERTGRMLDLIVDALRVRP